MAFARNDLSVSREVREEEHRRKLNYVLYTPSQAGVAKELLALPGASEHTRLGTVQWREFEDGLPNIFIKDVEELRNRDVVFLCDFLNPREMFPQLSVILALPGYLCHNLCIVLSYFPTGTMERVDHEGQIATAKTLARMLSSVPLTASGPMRLTIFDIHALQERFYFGDGVVPMLLSAVPIFLARLASHHANETVTIAFPDEGAQKRFGRFFAAFEQVICVKVRTSETGRKVTIKEGDVTGRHVFIVDDLVKTGGTLIECKNALQDKGAADVSAFVTHGVFPQESWKKFIAEPEGKRFKLFYLTDSCPSVSSLLEGKAPFVVLSIAQDVFKSIQDYRL